MKPKYKLLVVFICISLIGSAKDVYNRGLYFRSFEVDQDKRTSLNLTPQKELDFPNGFMIEFEIQLRKQDQNFGYVFRIIGNDSVNIDLVSDISSSEYLFSLVSGMKSLTYVKQSEIKNFDSGSWMKVVFTFNPKNKQIVFKINDLIKTVAFSSSRMKSINLFFGGNNHSSFATTDIPPMLIRDLKIYDSDKKLVRYWKLEKHTLNGVYDECSNEKAICVNPVWQIDNHVKWQQKAHITLPYPHPQITFDEHTERLFIVKGNRITIYNSTSDKIDSLKANKGVAYYSSANQLVFNEKNNELISYSFEKNTLAEFDFQRNQWTNTNTDKLPTNYWHHSKFFNSKDSSLITIGGYGYHKYKGVLLKYSLKDKSWKQNDISTAIAPRYLGSLGSLNNRELIYFGGFGNKTGNQEEFPKNYYDLYRIDKQTLQVKKIWEMNTPDEHFTNGNSLVVNGDKGVFYSLSYPNNRYSSSIRLTEFSVDRPEYKIVGDSIPYKFRDVESYCDLFYCSKSARLLAVTSVTHNDASEINVYSIAYPPLQENDVLQPSESKNPFKWYAIFLFLIALPIYLVVRNNKRRTMSVATLEDMNPDFKYEVAERELKPSSVNLLGYFQIIDKTGHDITGSFTQTVSQILVLILLYTLKNGKGISSQELADLLWYDKDPESARNNRNVNISKLRILLKNTGDIELVSNNSYWSIVLGKDFFCDYKNAMYLLDLIDKSVEVNIDIVKEFLKLAVRGVLLPNFQAEWVDSFKGVYTNSVIEILNKLTHKKEVKSDFVLLLKISDVILLHDNIDEEAAKIKVYSLYNLGKKGQAIQYYEKFIEDYKNLMGVVYKDSFNQFREITL